VVSGTGPASSGRLGGYQLVAELGRGGMGRVYRARQLSLGREVALKVLLGDAVATPRQRERFRLEAGAVARLSHPHVVRIHDFGEAQGVAYLAMDLVPGGSLADRLAKGPLRPREAAAVVAKVARALHYAHEQMVLHRDLKPTNVLIDGAGEPVVGDFGLAKLVDAVEAGPTKTGQVLGTPGYMAPEQLGAGGVCDWRADVFGLGATLYALLTGGPPFVGESIVSLVEAMTSRPPPSPSAQAPSVEGDLDTICLRCLEPDPADRYPTARALAEDLERYLADEPIAARPPGVVERLGKWSRRNPLAARAIVGSAAALLVGGVVAAVWVQDARGRARIATLEAEGRARADLAEEARGEAEAAWRAAEGAGPEAAGRLGRALRALEAAQRWRGALGPGDPAADAAVVRAADLLGEEALRTEQWDLAAEAFGLLRPFDAAAADERLADVERRRRARADARAAAVRAVLDDVASGAAGRRPDGLHDAVFELVRYAEPQTVALLAARLDAISERLFEVDVAMLREAAAPTAAERAGGARPIEGLEGALVERRAAWERGEVADMAGARPLARTAERVFQRLVAGGPTPADPLQVIRLELARRQRAALSAGEADLAGVVCRALGRLGIGEGATAALRRYLLVEADDVRAVPAGVALCRLAAGEDDVRFLNWCRRRYGFESAFGERVAASLPEGLRGGAADTMPGLGDPYHEAVLRIEYLLSQGELAAARRAAEDAVRRFPERSSVWSARGTVRGRQGDLQGSLADSERALELEPESAMLWNNRGFTRQRLGDVEGALADYGRALELDPDLALARENRAALLHRRGRTGEALAEWTRRIERAAEPDAEAFARRGLVSAQAGDLEAARRDMDRALALDPDLLMARINRGRVRLLQGDHAGALQDLERARALDPSNPFTWLNLANLRRAQGDPHAALADVRRCLELAPGHVDARALRDELEAEVGE